MGLVLGFLLMVATLWIFRGFRPSRVDGLFRKLQLLSAASYSLGHGTNDAQKTMGIIAILLFSGGYLGGEFYVPLWVILAAHAAIGLGTLAGGWRIIKTMGMRLTKLKTGGRLLRGDGGRGDADRDAAHWRHSGEHDARTIAGSIVGVGATQRLSAVRWGVAGKHRVGVDPDHPAVRRHRRDRLARPAPRMTKTRATA